MSRYVRPDRPEAGVNVLISAVDLLDIPYHARPFRAHCRYKQGDTCPDVGREHISGPEREFVVMTYDYGPVGSQRMIWAPMSMRRSTKKSLLSNIF